jgi:dihydrofolate reductase
MARLIFAMIQSLDGYVASKDGALTPPLHVPDLALFRHFVEHERGLAGSLYGRRMYETMRYWDDDQPDSEAHQRDFANVWRAHPKWVVARSSTAVGPNATLVDCDVEAFVRRLKSEIRGDIALAGPELAGSLTAAGLIDEYRLYVRPVALGGGKPYFAGAAPPLRLVGTDRIGDETVRLTYATC